VEQGASPLGSTIKLYLADGQAGGIGVVEKDNWSGVGVDCSRKDLPRARLRDEFEGSGVYVLYDFDDDSDGLPQIYVGETDDLGKRLATHANKKEGWGRLVIFTSKASSINKAHAKYLESRLCSLAAAAKRCVLQNKTAPALPKLGDSDRDQAETFLREVLVVLPVVGISEFDVPAATASATEPRFTLQAAKAEAEGVETAEGFKVFSGAKVVATEGAVSGATEQLRADLAANGALSPDGDGMLTLTQDYVFNSPSSAASVLIGSSVNGRTAWRLPDGRTLKEVQEEVLEEQ
jgi:predicted GIY-YIG superfamily endonuclease